MGLKRWIRTPDGRAKWDRFKLRVPIFGKLVQKVAISRFARTMSVLSRTGVPVLQALDIVSATAGNAMVSTALPRRAGVGEAGRVAGRAPRPPRGVPPDGRPT